MEATVPVYVFMAVITMMIGIVGALTKRMWDDIAKRIDAVNGGVREVQRELDEHKLWASNNYIRKDDCKDTREECPARKAVMLS